MSRSNACQNVIVVTPDSSKELKERVYRLRCRVCVTLWLPHGVGRN